MNNVVGPPTLEELVAARYDIGDCSNSLRREYEDKKAKLDEMAELIEGAINNKLSEAKGKSLYLPDGTCVSRVANKKITVTDWDKFDALIRRTNNLRLVQKRAGRNEVVAYIQSQLPDNVKIDDYFDPTKDVSSLPKLPVPEGMELYVEYNVRVKQKGD